MASLGAGAYFFYIAVLIELRSILDEGVAIPYNLGLFERAKFGIE